MKTEKRKSAYKEVPADRHACCQFTRGLGTPRTRQLSKSYTTSEMDGRASAGLCGDSTRCGAMSRSLYVSGKTCHSSSVLFTPDYGTGILLAAHKSSMVSIVATHSWRPRWVKMSRATHFVGTAGLPQTVCPSLKERLTLDITARVTRIGRAEPQTRRASREPAYSRAFVGIDTSKLRNAVAVAEDGRDGGVRYLGEVDTTEAATRKLGTKLAAKYRQLTFCYEAEPTGYGLYRLIKKLCHHCIVAAPSLIPKKPCERVKTNRHHSVGLAQLSPAAELHSVWGP